MTKKSEALISQSLGIWQRVKDSNPHIQSQSLLCYLYTNPLSCTRGRKRKNYYIK